MIFDAGYPGTGASLPFTGGPNLTMMAVIAVVVIGAGVLLRRLAR